MGLLFYMGAPGFIQRPCSSQWYIINLPAACMLLHRDHEDGLMWPTTFKDPLHINGGQVTQAKIKRMRKALGSFTADTWKKQVLHGDSIKDLGLVNKQPIIDVIQVVFFHTLSDWTFKTLRS